MVIKPRLHVLVRNKRADKCAVFGKEISMSDVNIEDIAARARFK